MAGADWPAVAGRKYRLQKEDTAHARFFFQPLHHFYHRNLEVLADIADNLALGTIPVCRMFRNRENQYVTEVDGVPSVLMSLPDENRHPSLPLGAALADFHRRTALQDTQRFPESPVAGRTSEWVGRIDALAKKYTEIQTKKQTDFFEQRLLANFPYFSGCAENAIQLGVDTFIDHSYGETAVIGHFRFSGSESLYPENPAFWVADDRSRDLAEWLRMLAWTRSGPDQEAAAESFLNDYEARFPLTDPLAAHLFSRLLFPLSFLECCERYFSGSDREDRQLLEETIRANEEKAGNIESMLAFLTKRYANRFEAPEWLASGGTR
ncbi:spore coat protein YutH [Sporolactobacillus sp. KGMB 08714]|uniref:spore coat protein YutH n=1 Tax=Sporolactobacillus sp. KGMB 08714 TaxID=3064704 RepID=UPI002FBE708C